MLESKALSRPYAKKLLQAMPPDRDKTPKDQAEDFLYHEKRRKDIQKVLPWQDNFSFIVIVLHVERRNVVVLDRS